MVPKGHVLLCKSHSTQEKGTLRIRIPGDLEAKRFSLIRDILPR